nr:large ribosomal subunit protein bL35m isoform X1 [Anolis sagrei ordinatus]
MGKSHLSSPSSVFGCILTLAGCRSEKKRWAGRTEKGRWRPPECCGGSQGSTVSFTRPLLSFGSTSFGHPVSIVNSVTPLLPSIFHQQTRTVIQFSLRKGKRKTVKAVVHRFLRLHSGLWLRRKAGYKKRLWKKSAKRIKRLREHVFCNKTQSKLLDKMTTSFWRRRNWYANDPYQKYHDRTNIPW